MATDRREYFRKLRATDKANGIKTPRGKSGKHVTPRSMFHTGQFIGVDSEGFDYGPRMKIQCQEDGMEYEYAKHGVNFLVASNSDGSICDEVSLDADGPTSGLDSRSCLDFLCDLGRDHPKSIFVIFAGGYDFTQWLKRCLSTDDVIALLKGQLIGKPGRKLHVPWVEIVLEGYRYRIECRMRKSLSIKRWKDGPGHWHAKPDAIKIWDVWGFFQGSFVKALMANMPEDPDVQMIAQKKAERGTFTRIPDEDVKLYARAEVRCLAAMMDKMRDALNNLGLTVSNWDGAGAVAAAKYRVENVKQHLGRNNPVTFPEEVTHAAACAYSGGHIEACKIGHYIGKVYHYDVNSAYPAQFRKLPSLNKGRWERGTGFRENIPAGFTLVKLSWSFPTDRQFYPLFYRTDEGNIFYPASGTGWYWLPEAEAAFAYNDRYGRHPNGDDGIQVDEWWHFRDDDIEFPFADWIETSYAQRKALVAESKATGVPNGMEKMIKLFLNSCYGKTAQQVGARFDPKTGKTDGPTYFQLEWAGYVTAGCRAELMRAAIQNMPAIISFATDAIFSTKPLDLPCPADKVLGQWEAQEHTEMTIVQPGVYSLDGKVNYNRGFDAKDFSFPHILDAWEQAWRNNKMLPGTVQMKTSRMVSFGLAKQSKTFWKMRGCFASYTRELDLSGKSHKRMAVDPRAKIWKGFYPIDPQEQDIYFPNESGESLPFNVNFGTMQGDMITSDNEDLEGQLCEMDAENFNDSSEYDEDTYGEDDADFDFEFTSDDDANEFASDDD